MTPEQQISVLIVEDESTIRHVLQCTLEEQGYRVLAAGSAEEGLDLLERGPVSVALLDIVLPGMSGIDLLGQIKRRLPDTEVVMMTSHASVETAVAAIRQGAYDFLLKPFDDVAGVGITVERAVEKRALTLKNRVLLEEQERRNQQLSVAVMRLSSLIDAGRAMGEFHVLAELLDFFIALVAKELDVERASLMLLDREGRELRIAAARGIDNVDVDSVRVRLGEGIAGSVAETGKAFLVEDTADRKFGPCSERNLSTSFISAPIVLSIPIKSREKVLGVINVTNRRSGKPFGREDLSYLSGLAGQLAVAVERASHFEELKQTYDSLKAAQEQLVFSERIKALGQMAAGVAHDFNNALSVILARTQFITSQLEQDPVDLDRVRSDVGTIKKISLQGAETIKRIQDYTRIRQDLPQEATDLNKVVRDAVEMTRPKWKGQCEIEGRSVDVRLDLGKLSFVSGNHHELTQVVGNLIFNAVEAMPEGGRLTIKTHQGEHRALLEVSDTGVGMDGETRGRLFEPFFTTKEDGHGLGTSVIYGIITRHGGEIKVTSAPGQGSTFRVFLPLSESAPDGHVRTGRAPSRSAQFAQVLLVEDDTMVRETYRDALRNYGHEVVALPSGDEAVALFDKHEFDLVVTDLSMAGLSGIEVTQQVKRLDPRVPVILISGWAVQQNEARIRDAGVDFVLSKPCLIEDLLNTVQQALRKRSAKETGPAEPARA